MKSATEVYETYRVPPWLQLHQVRVAAVGRYVALMHGAGASVEDIIRACLLHDIGAIVKFDFSKTGGALNGLFRPEDLEYWRAVQKEMQAKYGSEEHTATAALMKEMGVSERVQEIVNSTGTRNLRAILEKGDLGVMIVQYADTRVAPQGVTSLTERVNDVKMRYAERLQRVGRYDSYDDDVAPVYEIERRLFLDTQLSPEKITEESIRGELEWLWNFPLV